MKITLDNTTIVIFYRKDNAKRERNLNLILKYYNEVINNPKIILIQEVIDTSDIYQSVTSNVTLLTSAGDVDFWNKSQAYNKAINIVSTDVICFNDVDVIVDCNQLKQAEDYLTNTLHAGLIYPYDGRFLCVDDTLTNIYSSKLQSNNISLDILRSFEPTERYVNAASQHVFVGHNNSPGGVVMARRDMLVNINGYNPLFKNWGYEDTELLSRSTKLGYKCGRVMTGPCWHFDHTDINSAKKDNQPYYKANEQLFHQMESMNKEDLASYIKSKWKI